MFTFAFAAGSVCVLAWLYLLAARGGFWRIPRAPGHALPAEKTVTVAVVIPARNEADVIARAVASLLRQNFRNLQVFVIDDSSTDGTADAARQAAPSSDQLTVISGVPLPAGWSGKLWAVQQGVEQALRIQPDFLLLTDADIEHALGSVATLVGIAEAGRYDVASFMVRLHCQSFAEKLLIPAFVFFFFLLYPPQWVRDPRRRTAGAAGGCLLIRRSALDRVGGIAAIRHEIIDDCALARAVKRSGGKVWLGATSDTHSMRPYNSFAEVERMIARTAFNQLHHSGLLLSGTVIGMLLLYVLPLALIVSGSARLAMTGVAAYALMAGAYLPMVRFYRRNPLWALTLPLAGVFYTAATIHSAIKYWSGRGGEWKGRTQDVIDQ